LTRRTDWSNSIAWATPLAALDAVLDWAIFTPVLERIPRVEPKGPGGRPAYEPLLMFKILIIQSALWFE